MAKTGTFHPAPLDPHALGCPQRSDQVRSLILAAAHLAPDPDRFGRRRPGRVLDLGDLRPIPPRADGQLPGRQPGTNPQLTQPVSQDLASLLGTRR